MDTGAQTVAGSELVQADKVDSKRGFRLRT